MTGSSTADDVLNLRLPGGPEAAADARQALASLPGDIDPPTLETMRLLVTELIANVVKHTEACAVGLKVVVGSRSVLVEVSDPGPGFEPVPRYAGQDETSGWGLFLVERMARQWGVLQEERATRVWFELARA